jgi:hypothetical protein
LWAGLLAGESNGRYSDVVLLITVGECGEETGDQVVGPEWALDGRRRKLLSRPASLSQFLEEAVSEGNQGGSG